MWCTRRPGAGAGSGWTSAVLQGGDDRRVGPLREGTRGEGGDEVHAGLGQAESRLELGSVGGEKVGDRGEAAGVLSGNETMRLAPLRHRLLRDREPSEGDRDVTLAGRALEVRLAFGGLGHRTGGGRARTCLTEVAELSESAERGPHRH